MGADFIEKTAPTFKKSWDRERTELATADLFTRTPSCQNRTAVADIIGKVKLSPGDWLIVEVQGELLIARRRNTEVARIKNPLPDLVKAVKDSCGIAKGKVEQVYKMAGVVDISLC